MTRVWGLLLIIIGATSLLSAQEWQRISEASIEIRGIRDIQPDRFILMAVDDEVLKSLLWTAPVEGSGVKSCIIQVPDRQGQLQSFIIEQYQMMEPELAKQYPDIRTFIGRHVSNPAMAIRADYTVHGFRAVMSEGWTKTYIDHYQRNDKVHKVIYSKKDFDQPKAFTCEVHTQKEGQGRHGAIQKVAGDCQLREYRLAVTATGEYSNYHQAFNSGQSNLVLSAITTTVNRINQVYEADVAARFMLIANSNLIWYYDPATDPFTGNNAGSMISQNQTNTNAVIGAANYDVGHIFSTGGSGLASLGVICSNNSKARGVTGISNPVGDPFDIDYVSHELGHQFGANHTQNNSCNRNNSTAMEPGSASTIMGYAGICSPNVQNNSDAYFHAISIQEMQAVIASTSCPQILPFANVAPVIGAHSPSKTIPRNTPFVLDAMVTDGDGDLLYYCWEQMDNEVATMPPVSTNTQGPAFRSLLPVTESARHFPSLDIQLNGASGQWEVLPSVTRNMDFRLTVRDHFESPGCTDEVNVSVTVDASAGPFVVTSPGSAVMWAEGDNVTITWNVANTANAAVNCPEVDILLSYDGGMTWSALLADGVPNDGSQVVVVPSGTTTDGRIIVRGHDHLFYDISNGDITIVAGGPTFTMDLSQSMLEVCNTQSASIDVQTNAWNGFTDAINLSLMGNPTGTMVSFNPNPVVAGSASELSLTNLTGLQGNFSMTVTGQSGAISRQNMLTLQLTGPVAQTQLSMPINGSTGISGSPTLSWNVVSGAVNYEYQVATENAFTTIVQSGTITDNSVIFTNAAVETIYYWRVRASNNICGPGPWSEIRNFETAACSIFAASDLPISISASGTPTITSTLTIRDRGVVNDIDIVNLTGNHTYVADLNMTLRSPDGTSNTFWSDPCGSQNNFDINFDDEAANDNFPCPPTDGGNYQPDNPLSIFDTKALKGIWSLEVFDDANLDGGSLNSWGIAVCMESYCDLTVDVPGAGTANGMLRKALLCAQNGDTIFIENTLSGTIYLGGSPVVIDKDVVIQGNLGDNITWTMDDGQPFFIIEAGNTVTLEGIRLQSDDATTLIQNAGTLTLKNVDIQGAAGELGVENLAIGTLTLEGTVQIH